MITQVALMKLEVEVVAGAVLSGWHDEIFPFFAHHNPNYSAAWLKHILFNSTLFQCF